VAELCRAIEVTRRRLYILSLDIYLYSCVCVCVSIIQSRVCLEFNLFVSYFAGCRVVPGD